MNLSFLQNATIGLAPMSPPSSGDRITTTPHCDILDPGVPCCCYPIHASDRTLGSSSPHRRADPDIWSHLTRTPSPLTPSLQPSGSGLMLKYICMFRQILNGSRLLNAAPRCSTRGKKKTRWIIISGRKHKNPESTMRVTIPRSQLGRLVYCHYTNDAKATRKLLKLNINILGWAPMDEDGIEPPRNLSRDAPARPQYPDLSGQGVVRNKWKDRIYYDS